MSQSERPQKVDVAIIGGGIVGLTIANLLKTLPIKVALIEASEPTDWSAEKYDLRVSAISKASEELFKQIGIWDRLVESRVSPYSDMLVWESAMNGSDALEFTATSVQQENLGHIIENKLIREVLYKALDDSQKAKLSTYCPEAIDSIAVDEKSASLQLKSGKTIRSKLIIAADGANSTTRKVLHLTSAARSYEQVGLVAHLQLEKPHISTAYQRFHQQEVLAFLPLENSKEVSMVWSIANTKAERVLSQSPEQIQEQLSEFMQNEFGSVTLLSSVRSFPLQLLHAEQYVRERVVLCGDAAHAIHPLAGQGVNIGLLDARSLVETLESAWQKNYDLGDLSILRQYERSRKAANVRMMGALDVLLDVFQSQQPIVQNMRRFGMGLVNRLGPIKQELMQHALGLR